MAMSTFQKVTLATCLVLCVALLLPKLLLSGGRRDAAEGSGRFPSMMQRQAAPEGRGQRAASSGFSRAHNTEAIARAKGAGTGAGTGGKSNLAGQIIPVYGFGILLYILYILFKITSKGNNKPSENRFPSVRAENKKRKITDFELAQLQEKLKETELVMEKIVSNVNHSPDRMKGVTADQEESLLQQLTEITRVMQEGQLMEELAPEKKSQEDWEDYPEEPQQQWEHSHCSCHHSQQHQSPQTETETETERTQADGADLEEDVPEEVAGGGSAADVAEDPNKERESDITAVSEEDVDERKEGAGKMEPDVPEEELAGVLEELELTLKMTSAMEQEKVEDLTRTTETEASGSAVRRRNKRRRAKKASH
ncbi:protein RIC-3b [Anoplopoma fimbria]|uniref:protein RIC-3b n=1 Tax=Anoplopoma fimbria TaxID=229290 RepID=UPI0023EB2CA1|nr:protein RIC-3b [Anoplopoma fimbria]XP_054476168.1 protein RIC-3b [Anoplopoma fimbria]